MKLSVRATRFFANGTDFSLEEVVNAVCKMGHSLCATEPSANGTKFRPWDTGSTDYGTKYVCCATCTEAHLTGCFLGITRVIVVPTPSSLWISRLPPWSTVDSDADAVLFELDADRLLDGGAEAVRSGVAVCRKT
jgi:hypothetical protein